MSHIYWNCCSTLTTDCLGCLTLATISYIFNFREGYPAESFVTDFFTRQLTKLLLEGVDEHDWSIEWHWKFTHFFAKCFYGFSVLEISSKYSTSFQIFKKAACGGNVYQNYDALFDDFNASSCCVNIPAVTASRYEPVICVVKYSIESLILMAIVTNLTRKPKFELCRRHKFKGTMIYIWPNL